MLERSWAPIAFDSAFVCEVGLLDLRKARNRISDVARQRKGEEGNHIAGRLPSLPSCRVFTGDSATSDCAGSSFLLTR